MVERSNVALVEAGIDGLTERVHAGPLLVGVGLVTRGSSWIRVTSLWKENDTSTGAVAHALDRRGTAGGGVALSGMCPSPAKRLGIGSIPTQPAPGR